MATTGYSTQVSLTLIVEDGARLKVSHVGPSGLIIVDDCGKIPAGHAELIVSIDGRKRRHPIVLPEGISGPDVFVPFF
jgi:hypothetical protein